MSDLIGADIGGFIGRVSHAFLPPAVHHLKEYGLPRMLSRKLHRAGFINFLEEGLDLRRALEMLRASTLSAALKIETLSAFDRYILKVFYDGINPEDAKDT